MNPIDCTHLYGNLLPKTTKVDEVELETMSTCTLASQLSAFYIESANTQSKATVLCVYYVKFNQHVTVHIEC